jgi:putative hemolysin
LPPDDWSKLAFQTGEFGGIVGIVTLVEVLEAIAGDVPSLEERIRPEIRERENGTWLIDGTADIETLEDTIPGLDFGDDTDRTYQTLAGFILDHLGHIPTEGEIFTTLGWQFEIIDMDRPRIDKVLLQRPKMS